MKNNKVSPALTRTFAKYFYWLESNESSILNFPLQRRPVVLTGLLDGLLLAHVGKESAKYFQEIQHEFFSLVEGGLIINEEFYNEILSSFQDIDPKTAKKIKDQKENVESNGEGR